MKIYQYDDIGKTNQALGSFTKNGVPVISVQLVPIADKTQFFVLADPKELPKNPKVAESKPKEKASKPAKEEKATEPKSSEAVSPEPKQVKK